MLEQKQSNRFSVAEREFTSRLLVETGRYWDMERTYEAILASVVLL
ncbi:MAG: hypothetical protein P8101_21100 [Candidatus Thiodiazotropha sp.]